MQYMYVNAVKTARLSPVDSRGVGVLDTCT